MTKDDNSGMDENSMDENMKYAVVILDGASGEPLDVYGGQTTLEAAYTPHLDALASEGLVGLVANVPQGVEPSSSVACASIIGYDPVEYPIGRGALELVALGVDLKDDEVALRVNLTNVTTDGLMHSYSTDNISSEDAHEIAWELKAALDDETFTLYMGAGFRLYLVVKGHPALLDTSFEAAHNYLDKPVVEHRPKGPEAPLIMDFEERAKQVLAVSPVNARRVKEGKLPATHAFVFWPGTRPMGMENFAARYHKQAGLNSGVDLLNGIAQLVGMRRYQFDGVSDGPDNDYAAQGEGALVMLAENDIVFVHVEAPDAEGHDGNITGKLKAIEAIDREIISRLRQFAAKHPLRIMALPDHPTPVVARRHSSDPVPFILAGPGIEANAGKRLTEIEAEATGLIIDPGYELLKILLNS